MECRLKRWGVFLILWFLISKISMLKTKDVAQQEQLKLLEQLFEMNGDRISVTFEDSSIYRKRKELEKSLGRSQNQKDQCINAIGNMTERLYSYPYNRMLMYSAKDVNDLGDSRHCKEISNARFYILSVGVKQLPLALRFGLCLPIECTPEIIDGVFQKLTNVTNEIVEQLMKNAAGNIHLPTDVIPVLKIEAISTEKWDGEQKESKLTGSYIMIIITGMLCIFVFLGSSYYHLSINHYRDLSEIKYEPCGEESKVSDPSSAGRVLSENTDESYMKNRVDNFGSTNEYSQTVEYFGGYKSENGRSKAKNEINYSMYENMSNAVKKRIRKSKEVVIKSFKEKPILKALLSCFSLQISFDSLFATRRNDEEHEELEVLEGIRTLTMFWGVFTATSLYVLVAYVQNIYEMLHLFESILFTMVASGNLAPDLFIFICIFLGFVKISQIYEERKGIIPSVYAKLIIYRYFKYAPLYYFVFFFGWSIFPYFSNADTWYLSETLFKDCDKYWWSNLLFIGNFYPWFIEGMNACYYWPFMIVCDFQYYLFLPLIVIIFKRKHIVFQTLMFIFLIGGSILDYYVFYMSKLSVGVLTLENYYLFSQNFNKTYTKFPVIALGCWMGQFYLNVLEYRKCGNDPDKKKANFGLIHIIHSSLLVKIFLIVYGIGVFNLTTLIPFTANKDAYSWTRTQNAWYGGLCRFGYISPIMALLSLVFCERIHILHPILGNKYFRPFSKVTLGAYLVYPIVIMMVYTGLSQPIFLSIMSITYLFLYNLITSYLIAFALFMIVQSPFMHIVGIVIFKYRELTSLKEYVIEENLKNKQS